MMRHKKVNTRRTGERRVCSARREGLRMELWRRQHDVVDQRAWDVHQVRRDARGHAAHLCRLDEPYII